MIMGVFGTKFSFESTTKVLGEYQVLPGANLDHSVSHLYLAYDDSLPQKLWLQRHNTSIPNKP